MLEAAGDAPAASRGRRHRSVSDPNQPAPPPAMAAERAGAVAGPEFTRTGRLSSLAGTAAFVAPAPTLGSPKFVSLAPLAAAPQRRPQAPRRTRGREPRWFAVETPQRRQPTPEGRRKPLKDEAKTDKEPPAAALRPGRGWDLSPPPAPSPVLPGSPDPRGLGAERDDSPSRRALARAAERIRAQMRLPLLGLKKGGDAPAEVAAPSLLTSESPGWLSDVIPPETVLPVLSCVVGAATGLSVVIFNVAIRTVHHWALEDDHALIAMLVSFMGPTALALIPAIAGVLVAILRERFDFDSLPTARQLFAATGGNLSKVGEIGVRPIAKSAAAAISLGAGASLGPEGPSVEIGANCGLLVSRFFDVPSERQRLLLGCGSAAGIAAGFNAPTAGVFFALEIGKVESGYAPFLLLSAVMGSLMSNIFLGEAPAFVAPVYSLRNLPLEMVLYLGLGACCAITSISTNWAIAFARQVFEEVGKSPLAGRLRPLFPAIAGLTVGLIALEFPQIMFNGYATVSNLLENKPISALYALSLVVAKTIGTAVSLGGGLVGGVFAPSLFLGAGLGTAYQKYWASLLGSSAIAEPSAYALVGMAATLAGIVGAPLTSILLLLELTRSHDILLPLMAAVGLSTILEQTNTAKRAASKAREVAPAIPELAGAEDEMCEATGAAAALVALAVCDVMLPVPLLFPPGARLTRALEAMLKQRATIAVVQDDDARVRGVVTLSEINAALKLEGSEFGRSLTLADVVSSRLAATVGPATPVLEARQAMDVRGVAYAPVVDDQGRVVGVLDREFIRSEALFATARRFLDEARLNSTSPAPELLVPPETKAAPEGPEEGPEGEGKGKEARGLPPKEGGAQ
eukprot:tig00021094_g18099.t1